MGTLGRTAFFAVCFPFLIWGVSANSTTTTTTTTFPPPHSSTTSEARNPPVDSSTPEPETPAFVLPSNLTLRKCRCSGNQELHGSECLDSETYVAVVDLGAAQELAFRSNDFASVTIGDVQCPPGFLKGRLLNYIDRIYVLTNGELFWYNGQQFLQDYCVEHVPGGWEASACLPPPVIPRCCPPGYALGPDDSCLKQTSSQTFSPPLTLNNEIMGKVEVDGDVTNITCSGISVMRRVNLDGQEGGLLYGLDRSLLTYETPSYVPHVEPEEEYCVGIDESESETPQFVAKFCYSDPKQEHYHACKNATCVRKCCPPRQILMDSLCVELEDHEEPWQPVFYEKDILKPGTKAPKDLFYVFGLPLCEAFFELKPHVIEHDKYYLQRDGSLHYPAGQDLEADSYCIDAVMDKTETRNFVLICSPEDTCDWKEILDVILLSLSCVFYIATLGVYLGVAELRDRTNGRCLISMVVAMLATYISLIVNYREKNPTNIECLLTGFVGHFFGLAMFFWLNVMCYDMWSTLRSSQHQHQSKKTFIKYSIYAWGIPLVIAITARIIDSIQPNNFILPNFLVDKRCWFQGYAEYWLYLSGVIFVLLVINTFFFIHVAITLARKLRKRQSTFANQNSQTSNANNTREQKWLYVKLFIVMGVVWIADASSSIQHRYTCSYWVVTDIFNGLQGLFIFLVAVCNKDNMKKVRSAWKPRVQSMRSKITTMRGRSPVSSNRKTDISLVTSDASRKTSVTSLPRKISTTSVPLQKITELSVNSEDSRNSKSSPLPPRKISATSNSERVPMTTLKE